MTQYEAPSAEVLNFNQDYVVAGEWARSSSHGGGTTGAN